MGVCKLTLGSLFNGIGGWILAGEHNGITTLWESEIDKFCEKLMKVRFPNVKQLGDVTKIVPEEIEPVDIICAGSPCQDLSVAGKREGLSGERSGLFRTAVSIVHRMRMCTGGAQPRFFIWENVPGAFSSNKGLDFKAVLEEIGQTEIPMPDGGKWANAGLAELPGCDIAWRVLDAQFFGVPQRRKRIFLVADFAATGRCAAEILFIEPCLPGDTEPGGEAGKATAGATQTGIDDTSADVYRGGTATVRMRSGKPGGGKGALVSYGKSLTLAANANDQAVFQKTENSHDNIMSTTGGAKPNGVRKPRTGCTGATGGRCSDFICESGNGREQSADSDGEYP